MFADESYFVYAGKNSSNILPEILNALTPSVSAFVYESVEVTIFNNPLSAVAPVATDEDRSGSKSTSEKETELVEKELADAVVLFQRH